MENKTVLADGPRNEILSVIKARMLPTHPAVRRAVLVKRENQRMCAHTLEFQVASI
jgi:hypothetical protein